MRRVVVHVGDGHENDRLRRPRALDAGVGARDGDVISGAPLAVKRRRRGDELELAGRKRLPEGEPLAGSRNGTAEPTVVAGVGVVDRDVGDERAGLRVFGDGRHAEWSQRVDGHRRRVVVDIVDADHHRGV